ncbi:MAG: error-prone DNA polymerase, partial [Gammaproteobacteria bacterium]
MPMPDSLKKWHNFNEWLCKTNFSFLQGASHPVDIVERANHLGYGSICINDFDGVYGLARSYRELDYLVKQGQHSGTCLHYGAEIHLSQDHSLPILLQNTLVLIARNLNGYGNLNRILSDCHRDGKDNAFIDLERLSEFSRDDLIAIQPMRGLIRYRHEMTDYDAIHSLFPGCYYLTINRCMHPAEDCWIKPTLAIARKFNLNTLISQDVFMHNRDQKYMSDLLHAIRRNKVIHECPQDFFPNGERCLHTAEELDRLYRDIPGVD